MINWPNTNFNFNLDSPETILLGASVLFLLIGGILVALGQIVGIIFLILGFMFLGIGLVILVGDSGGSNL